MAVLASCRFWQFPSGTIFGWIWWRLIHVCYLQLTVIKHLSDTDVLSMAEE